MNNSLKNKSLWKTWIIPSAVIVLLSLPLWLGKGCDRRMNDSPYKVIDTGYWVEDVLEPEWLDNNRIAFMTSNNLLPSNSAMVGVKINNTATGELVSTPLYNILCVRDGQAMFVMGDEATGERSFYRGPLENAKKHPDPGPNMMIDEKYNCDWRQQGFGRSPSDSLPSKSGLRGENYLEILEKRTIFAKHEIRASRGSLKNSSDGSGSKGKVIYHQDKNDPGREVPSIALGNSYSEYLDAYVVGLNHHDPTDPLTSSFWILKRNGDLKEVPYPKALQGDGRLQIFPVKAGYLIEYDGTTKYTGSDPGSDPGDRGLYLIQGEEVHRLILGAVHSIRISPDGCKASFIHAANTKEYLSNKKPYRTLKYLNFCDQEEITP